MSSRYYFQLGSNFELSRSELASVYPEIGWQLVAPGILTGHFHQDFSPQTIIDQLGGTIKIFKHLQKLDITNEDQLRDQLAKYLSNLEAPKITIGLAEIGRDHLPKMEISSLKKDLELAGKKVRYVAGSRHGLSAAVLLHKEVIELVVIQTQDGCYLAHTVAVQNIDHWSKKDRGKPYANRKKGLLPPKVARIMVNLAVGNADSAGQVLCDPFCGTGTILMEALEKSLTVIGADNDQAAVDGTTTNLNWLATEMNLPLNFMITNADATQFQPSQQPAFIVTEPFLGRPKPKADQIPNIFKGLSKLYLGCFKNWRKFLPNHAKVVMVFPRALASSSGLKKDYTLHKLIDNLSKLGYITQSEPILYHRPGAVIAREIYIFEYHFLNISEK